jgi:CO/xanthine dehydrogenase Mo-binding subunit
MVRASDMPEIELCHHESPTQLNPLGVKGIGESGVLPIPAAIASAVEGALSPFGICIRQSPVERSQSEAAEWLSLVRSRSVYTKRHRKFL